MDKGWDVCIFKCWDWQPETRLDVDSTLPRDLSRVMRDVTSFSSIPFCRVFHIVVTVNIGP